MSRLLTGSVICLSLSIPAFAATFTVTTNADAGSGSLREAVAASNASAGPDAIAFSVGAGGPQIIELATALPSLADAVVIDGTTQPGFAGTPIITLDGPGTGVPANGLTILSSPVTIRGLVIVDFREAGIRIEGGGGGATIAGNYIGLTSGSTAKGNRDGVRIIDVDGVTVGGTAPGDRNVISGNRRHGIMVLVTPVIGASDGHGIQGNIIGLDAGGTFALGNAENGIVIIGGDDNRIGGTAPGEGNVISGNGGTGIWMEAMVLDLNNEIIARPTGNVVQANVIGTNWNGTAPIPNGADGVGLYGALETTLGGPAPGARNIISGNGGSGVKIDASCEDVVGSGCAVSVRSGIEGNFIGTDVTGTLDFGNSAHGVSLSLAADTTIRANIISGNAFHGIYAYGYPRPGMGFLPWPTADTLIVSNRIGTDSDGTAALPNGGDGIRIHDSTTTTVGGSGGAEGNIIRFNMGSGIVESRYWCCMSVFSNRFLGNSIDLNGGLGIDTGAPGVDNNGPLSGPTDPYPVLTSATVDGATVVRGRFNSTPNRTLRIEFFNGPLADPSGHGEGSTFLGWTDVTTDAGGNATIAATLPAVPIGSVVTATATDLTSEDTTEFSNAVTALESVELNVGEVSMIEGDSGTTSAVFTVSLGGVAAHDVTFQYATADGSATAPDDYMAVSGTGVIPAGSLLTTVIVPVHGDTVFEPEETFVVNITAVSGATAGDTQGQATIANDDAAPSTATIPTASEWALLLLALSLAFAGMYVMRS